MHPLNIPPASRRRWLATISVLLLTTLSCAGTASAAQDGTIFDDRVFEWRYYIDPSVNSDLQAAGINSEALARWHWQAYGLKEGRRGGPGFYSREYLANYADLRNAYGATNWSGAVGHYLAYGYNEKRYSQNTCGTNYELSGYNVNVPRYCYAKTLNATITSTDQSFSKYLFCFPLPPGGRIVSGLSGNVSINTNANQDNPSEALITVGYVDGTCPPNGTKYTQYPIPFNGTATTLGSFILKRLGAGGVSASTNIDIPARATSGNLYVLFDGGPSLGGGRPITSITMQSNVSLKTATTAVNPVPYTMDGTDEYCYGMSGGCQQATPQFDAIIAHVQRVTGAGGKLVGLVGNVSAGAITRPSATWNYRNDWYVDYNCAHFPMAGKWAETFANTTNIVPMPETTKAIYQSDLAVPAGVPTYGFTLTGSGDSLQQTVNLASAIPVTSGVDCIVHLTTVIANSQINAESQVRYVIKPN